MKSNVRKFVLFAFFVAIELVLMFTPLGYIPLGVIRATTMHIPVIICAILLGVKEGALLGFVFGLTSLFINTFTPTITSFVFSPFITIGGVSGNFYSLLIVLLPRITLGLVAGLMYKFLSNKISKELNIIITSITATFIHTVLVLGGIYVFFAKPYASVRNIPLSGLFNVLLGIVGTNGVIEMILSAIIVLAVVKVSKPLVERSTKYV
ncbi:MAG: ECF transporter S component [Erysipelotrichaceae bacterium]|nr:ECF transporter S component [Erysipelotrichaceae bacterium]